MNNNRFILQKYKGRSTRFECPQCHRPRCFTRYIDTEGVISFPDHVGRCDHEHRCGYHYTPRQFFHDNPEAKKLLFDKVGGGAQSVKVSKVPHMLLFDKGSSDAKSAKVSKVPHILAQEPYYFDVELVKRSYGHYSMNNLYRFMARNFGRENAHNLFARYCVGTSKFWNRAGATLFWLIDVDGRPRDGKIMLYDAETGRRSKEERHHVNWVHSLMKVDKERTRPCFFGEHLIRLENNLAKPIAIVESEKTAIIASFYLPQYVWIASGGKDGMFNQADMSIFQGREVVFFPDLGMTDNWRTKAIALQRHGIKASVYDFLEHHASEMDRQAGLDIADFLLQAKPREYLLQSMIERNPAMGQFVKDFDLELVEGE